MSYSRRLRAGRAGGVSAHLRQVLLERLHAAGATDRTQASLEGTFVPVKNRFAARPKEARAA